MQRQVEKRKSKAFYKSISTIIFLKKQLSVEDITYQQRAVFDIMLMEADRYADVKNQKKCLSPAGGNVVV